MAILSLRAKRKVVDVSLVAMASTFAWMLQVTVLNHFIFAGVVCNLPLTLTILFGYVFASSTPSITADELRVLSVGQIFLRQVLSGSVYGFLVGAFIAALYASVLPIYPLFLPIIGWIAGYFGSRHIAKETLMCIPVVLLLTVMAEGVMAFQLAAIGRPNVFDHLSQIVLPEALLNALIAPFVYFPICRWHEFLYEYLPVADA
jgi:rod shape-determining protein MreD